MDKAKAQELIAEFERHQQEQIRCLQALIGLASENVAKEEPSYKNDDEKSSKESPEEATNSPSLEYETQIPDDWAMPWSNALLRQRIEEREQEPGCGGGLRRRVPDVDRTDAAARFIVSNALKDLAYYTFERDDRYRQSDNDSVSRAFCVIDTGPGRQVTLDTRTCSGQQTDVPPDEKREVLRTLFSQSDRCFHSKCVLSTILLCAAQSKHHDYATAYAALRRHLSPSHTDRHYDESHIFQLHPHDRGSSYRNVTAFTVPYFSLMDGPPAADFAPLFPSGRFGIDEIHRKYIREQKFSLSWSGGWKEDEPSLMVALSPLTSHGFFGEGRFSALPWLENNFFDIIHGWEEVLDWLDTQTTISGSITFNSETRQGFLFEDRDFSNTKRYFWALQSLRLFAGHIEVTSRSLDNIFYSVSHSDGRLEDDETVKRVTKNYQEKFAKLGERIEHKRQEIQSLSDGLFSASSVSEARLAAEQNGNIRLLTMVTIAYLPLTLATSIYGMNALPKGAGIVSWVVVTIIMCTITYVFVFYIRELKDAISWGRNRAVKMVHSWKHEKESQP